MSNSLLTLPLRLTARGAGLALGAATAVGERTLGIAGAVADTLTGAGGASHGPTGDDSAPARAQTMPPPAPPAPAPPAPGPDPAPPGPAPAPAPPAPPPAPEPPPAPPEPAPPHISTEPDLVRSDADPGAEDGAGAQVHIQEPWEGYRALRAADVVDRVAGADPAELAAVELYELSGRRRQTVLNAVAQELAGRRGSGQ